MQKKTKVQTYQTPTFKASLFELASNLYLLKVEGKALTMSDVHGTNDLLKVKLTRKDAILGDTHFIVDTSHLEQVPKDKNVMRDILNEMIYLRGGNAGYIFPLLLQKNFVIEAFMELVSEFARKFFGIKQILVTSPDKIITFLSKNLDKKNILWSEVTPEELLKKIEETIKA